MRSALTLSATAIVIFLVSCRRDNVDSPKPQTDPKLKRTVTTDVSTGRVMHTTRYNNMELIESDSAFSTNGTAAIWTFNEYNSKSKPIKSTLWAPVFNQAGYHWLDTHEYVDDTLPVISRHYLDGTQTLLTKHFYNPLKQLILDSCYSTAIGATVSIPYTYSYSYDAQGRLLTQTRLNDKNDSVFIYSYKYSTNHRDITHTSWSYNPTTKGTSLVSTDFTTSGKILLEKNYSTLNQITSQTEYTYDSNGNLTMVLTTDLATYVSKDVYTNNAAGRPVKKETFYQNNPTTTTIYYYE